MVCPIISCEVKVHLYWEKASAKAIISAIFVAAQFGFFMNPSKSNVAFAFAQYKNEPLNGICEINLPFGQLDKA